MHELLALAQEGDRDAFAALAAGRVDILYAVAFGILRDPERAADAAQQALLNAWRQLPSLRDPARFDGWCDRLVVSASYEEARRRRAWKLNISVLPAEPTMPDAESSLADRDELERAFRRLSPEQRAVAVMHYYLGLDLIEIAETATTPRTSPSSAGWRTFLVARRTGSFRRSSPSCQRSPSMGAGVRASGGPSCLHQCH